ncbi:heparin lyase I family protein [Bradyrhizobium sp. UFLA05-109]
MAADSRGSVTLPSGTLSGGARSSAAMNIAAGTDEVPRAPVGEMETERGLFSGANDSIIEIGGTSGQVQNANQMWSLTSPENHAFRFEVRPGDHWSNSGWSDLLDNDGAERSEIELEPRFESGITINVSYEFMIETGAENTSPWLVIGQFHQTNASGPPPFAVALTGEHMQIIIRNVPKTGLVAYRDPNPIQRGRYYSMSIQVRFDDKKNGALSVSRDGVQLVRYQGLIGYGRSETYYWKEGIYRARGSTAPMAAVYKDLRVTTTRSDLPQE